MDRLRQSSRSGPETTTEETEVYYILIHSPNPQNHLPLSCTPSISGTVTSELQSASFEQIKTLHASLYATAPRNIEPVVFLILDLQSMHDRSVVIINKDLEFGDKLPGAKGLASDPKERTTVWKKYRCPYEKAFRVQCALEAFGGPEPTEPFYVEELGRGEYISSEEDEEDESSEEDEEDESSEEESGDSEFEEDNKP